MVNVARSRSVASSKQNVGESDDTFYTVPEAAAMARLSVRTMWRRLESGLIAKHDFDGCARISRRDLIAYIRSRRLAMRPKRKKRGI